MKLGDFETLSAARTHTESRGVILNANDMGVIFDKHPGNLSALEAIESTDESVRVFLTLFRSGGGRFDFRKNEAEDSPETDCDRLSSKINSLVEAGTLTLGFATAVFNAANVTVKPFEKVSEYEWRKARGESIDKKEVAHGQGYLDILTTSDVEAHRPTVYALIAGKYRHITSLPEITKAGNYSCQVPRKDMKLYVDNFYGVIV